MTFFDEAAAELARSNLKHRPNFYSLHEGYAVLLEEVDELWDIVRRQGPPDAADVRRECLQIAAMAAKIARNFGAP